MELLAIVARSGPRLWGYTAASLAPASLVGLIADPTADELFLALRDDTHDFTISCTELFNAHPSLGSLEDWDDLLTTDWLESLDECLVPCPGLVREYETLAYKLVPTTFRNDSRALRGLSLDAHLRMDVAIGSGNSTIPVTRPLWGSHPDLVFSWRNQPAPPDVTQLIPVCGGALYRPSVVDDRSLLALNARDTLRGIVSQAPEYMALDFSSVGGMEITPLSDCIITTTTAGAVTVQLPGTVDTSKPVILVLHGRMLLPGTKQLHWRSDDTLELPPEMVGCRPTELERMQRRQQTIRYGSLALRAKAAPLLSTDTTSFVISLPGITRLYRTVCPQTWASSSSSLIFPPQISGFLENAATGLLRDYVGLRYTNRTKVMITPRAPVLTPALPGPGSFTRREVGFLSTRDNPTRYRRSDDHGWQCVEYLGM